jgi:hypothetical protein
MDDAQRLLEHFSEQPPSHILLNLLTRSFTSWEPPKARIPGSKSKPTAKESMAIASLPMRTLDNMLPEVQAWWSEISKGKPN